MLRGARQVGKSTLIREFSKEYDCFIELNLERKEDISSFPVGRIQQLVLQPLDFEDIPVKAEVVKTSLKSSTFTSTQEEYEEIWETYKDRITFSGFGNSNYRSREVGEALRSLDKSPLCNSRTVK